MARSETTVMRNQVSRKDAAYIVTVRPGQVNEVFDVAAHYGPWSQFMRDQRGLSHLQTKRLGWFHSYERALNAADAKVREKKGRGYIVVDKTFDETNAQIEFVPQPEPEKAPEKAKTVQEKYGKDSMIARLLARSK